MAGCTSMRGWFGGSTDTPTPTPQAAPAEARQVYYAGVKGLKMFAEPATSSRVVGVLSLHEKVIRTKVERGFASVERAADGKKGWVNNAQLIWRLPSAPANEPAEAPTAAPAEAPAEAPAQVQPEEPQAPAAEEPTESLAPESAAPPEEIPPTPTSPPAPAAVREPKATPRGVAPSIFNPY